jgi:hypothetical protein
MWIAAWEMRGKTPSDAVIALAYRVLANYELLDIAHAIDAHITDPDRGSYTVTPADIIKHLQGGKAERGQSAFDAAYRAACRIGPYQSVVFDDPLIHAVVSDMGGWQQFCNWDIGENEEKKPFMMQEFIKRYAHYAAHPPRQHLRQLTGIFDSTNRMNGPLEHIKPPLLIGDQQAAERVYLTGGDSLALGAVRAPKLEHDAQKALAQKAVGNG